MNFKKTWKRGTEGFTLVELIVVIAILAILAGIAVPAYSGYIKKANKAADLQLLGAVNTAFAAACLENGENASEVSGASITLTGEVGAKSVAGISVEGMAEPFTTSFMRYYDGNTATFKVIKALRFAGGVFVEDEGNSISYGGGSIFVTDAQLAALKDSTFNSEALGLEGLLDQVDTMATLAMSFGNDAFMNVIGTEAYMTHMIRALGGDVNAEDITTEFARVASGLADARVAEKMNITVEELRAREDYDDLVASTQQEIGQNMAVLYAAQNASNRTSTDVMNVINSPTLKTDLLKSMTGENPGQGLGDAALVYGAFTAYAYATNSEAGIAAIQNSDDPTAVFDLLTSGSTELANFQNYMNTNPQGAKDLDATLSAMGVVNNSASDQAALTEVLLNGYNDAALKDMISDLMGE